MNRLLVLASAVLACAMPAEDNTSAPHLNILKDGKWYGWPQCYLPNQPNPEFSRADCSGVEPPALTVLLVMPDGALLVIDDTGDRIWRVSYGR